MPSRGHPLHRLRLLTTRLAAGACAAGACAAVSCAAISCAPLGLSGRGTDSELWGFTVPWDPRSAISAERHGSLLDALVTGWISLDSATAHPMHVVAGPRDAGREGTLHLALVTSWQGERFHPGTIRRLGADPRLRAEVAAAVAGLAERGEYDGLVLDFSGLTPRDLMALVTVSRAIADSARGRGVGRIAVALPATDTAGYPARPLLAAADLFLVMLYDQHWRGSPPGPIAEPAWVRQQLALRIAEVGAERVVAAFPLYGYLWRHGAGTEMIGHDDARRIAGEAGLLLEREPATRTLRASRPGAWELWVSDAGLLRALLADARAAGVRRFAYWYLGLEDPAVWRLGRPGAPD